MNEINLTEEREKLICGVFEDAGNLPSFYDTYAAIKEIIKERNITQIDCPEFLKFLKMAFAAGFVQCAVDTKDLLDDKIEAENE